MCRRALAGPDAGGFPGEKESEGGDTGSQVCTWSRVALGGMGCGVLLGCRPSVEGVGQVASQGPRSEGHPGPGGQAPAAGHCPVCSGPWRLFSELWTLFPARSPGPVRRPESGPCPVSHRTREASGAPAPPAMPAASQAEACGAVSPPSRGGRLPGRLRGSSGTTREIQASGLSHPPSSETPLPKARTPSGKVPVSQPICRRKFAFQTDVFSSADGRLPLGVDRASS